MVQITFSDCCFSAEGHANYAENGKDIICASVSMLVYTMGASLEGCIPTFEPGFTEIVYADCPKNKAIIEAMEKGFTLLSDNYPDYVKVRVNEKAKTI